MAWWDVQFCRNDTVNGWLYSWNGMCPSYKHERVWCSLFFAITWTIWECRNQLDFEEKKVEVRQAADLVKFRIVWWFKHIGKGSNEAVELMLLNLKDLCVDQKKSKVSKIVDWIPPDLGYLKFNVDGSAKGKPGPAGMGGVLRNSYGKVLCLFSVHLGTLDSNIAELFAIKKATELIAADSSLDGCEVLVVSDSKVAVGWVNNGEIGNVSHWKDIFDIREILAANGHIKVVFDSRIFNSFADSLAKMGSNSDGDFIVWGDFG